MCENDCYCMAMSHTDHITLTSRWLNLDVVWLWQWPPLRSCTRGRIRERSLANASKPVLCRYPDLKRVGVVLCGGYLVLSMMLMYVDVAIDVGFFNPCNVLMPDVGHGGTYRHI